MGRNRNETFVRIKKGGFVLLALVVLSSSMGGCATLRKKFVRKRKPNEQASRVEPVLTPIEYPAPVETPESVYRQAYEMWRAWHEELDTAFSQRANDKRMLYTVDKLIIQTQRLHRLVAGPQAKKWQGIIDSLQGFKQQLAVPAPLRDTARMESVIRESGRTALEYLRPGKVSLVKAPHS